MLYFLQCEENGPIKIGHTQNGLEARIAAMRSFNPYPIYLLNVIDGGTSEEDEFHIKFATSRIHGEWFQPTPELLALIESLPVHEHIPLPQLQRKLLRYYARSNHYPHYPPIGNPQWLT